MQCILGNKVFYIYSRVGKKLVHVRGILEQELQAMVRRRADTASHHPYIHLTNQYELHKHLYVDNPDRQWGCSQFSLGQVRPSIFSHIFKGHGDEGTPCDQGTLPQN